MRALALAALALVGCNSVDVPPLEHPLVTPSHAIRLHGDTRFTPDERAECEAAAWDWVRFTNGNARITVAWDWGDVAWIDLPPPILYRSPRTPETGSAGGITKDGIVRLVPETCRMHASLKACAMHEYGHLLGLSHFEEIGGQVMSTCGEHPWRGCGPSGVFGVADMAECERVGVCRRRRPEVTTVTLTVDPSVPQVEPEYPR